MKARVKPNNKYGHDGAAGSIVEVDEAELKRVPWCLEAVEDDAGDVEVPDIQPADDAAPEAPASDDNLPAMPPAIDLEQPSVASAPVAGSTPDAPAKKGKAKS